MGINIVIQEESHTSKCSSLDNDRIENQEKYTGKRMERCLLKSAKGTFVHADLQAVYNIIKKAVPEVFADLIWSKLLFPRGLSIKQMITSEGER
jgi:putative transposase